MEEDKDDEEDVIDVAEILIESDAGPEDGVEEVAADRFVFEEFNTCDESVEFEGTCRVDECFDAFCVESVVFCGEGSTGKKITLAALRLLVFVWPGSFAFAFACVLDEADEEDEEDEEVDE
jgi:hypothetical protein